VQSEAEIMFQKRCLFRDRSWRLVRVGRRATQTVLCYEWFLIKNSNRGHTNGPEFISEADIQFDHPNALQKVVMLLSK